MVDAMNRRQCVTSTSAAILGLTIPRWSVALSTTLAMRPNAWFARVTGAPPGKERCSSTELISFISGAKQWLRDESVPDFLLLARETGEASWVVSRGYTGNGKIRRDSSYNTLRQARTYALDLTGGFLAPWVGLPQATISSEEAHRQLVMFARMQIAAEQYPATTL